MPSVHVAGDHVTLRTDCRHEPLPLVTDASNAVPCAVSPVLRTGTTGRHSPYSFGHMKPIMLMNERPVVQEKRPPIGLPC